MKRDYGKFAALSSIGAALEYYDYVLFGLSAQYIAQVFFPNSGGGQGFVKTVFVFSAAPWARSLLGILLFSFLRRMDVRRSLILSMMLMAFSTFAIGIIPSVEVIGVLAPVLLIVFRSLQGAAFAVELPYNLHFGSDYLGRYFSLFTSVIISSFTLGSIIAHVVMWSMTHYFSCAQIVEKYWRIPFLLGGVLGVLGYFMRRNVSVTSKEALTIPKVKVHNIMLAFSMLMIQGLLITNAAYFSSTLTSLYSFSHEKVYFASLIGLFASFIFAPCIGFFTYRTNIRYSLLFSISIGVMLLPLSFFLLERFGTVTLFTCLYQFVTTCFAAVIPVFCTRVLGIKGIAMAFVYNFVWPISALSIILVRNYGFTPIICIYILLLILSFVVVNRFKSHVSET
ncbi:MFS transporter [Candidatus Sneabacter namystus]|uniref:MHS family MFS transporter n=1 Tax=Candidatus Sneabacter namystus TaxID=2601646 RepID=A0A5C0UJA0_9RICK|nr:MHS family MFS transporter [Candidatus Sneabacter namystus]QEK39869.1 MHS family MFS transporter [Candidatus Sneabacter namystus]